MECMQNQLHLVSNGIVVHGMQRNLQRFKQVREEIEVGK